MGLAKTSFGLSDKRISTNSTSSMLYGGSDKTLAAVQQQQKRMRARQDSQFRQIPYFRVFSADPGVPIPTLVPTGFSGLVCRCFHRCAQQFDPPKQAISKLLASAPSQYYE